jgi:hypothetical protein
VSNHPAPRLALAAWLATAAMLLLWAVTAATVSEFSLPDAASGASYAALLLGMATLGVLISRREPRNAVGWLFCATPLLVSLSVGLGGYGEWGARHHGPAFGSTFAVWAATWPWAAGLLGYALLLPLLFPDGRPPGPRWRFVLWADLTALTVVEILLAIQPGKLDGPIVNPIGVDGADSAVIVIPLVVSVLVLICCGLASAIVRYRRAGAVQRLQMRAVVLAVCVSVAAFVLISVLDGYEALYNIDYALPPIAVAAAMLRYRLYDVDVIIRRTIAYAWLVAMLALIYLLCISVIGWGLRDIAGRSSALSVTLSTLAAAAAFQPLRSRIQRAVDRRFYRARYDAVRTLEAFSGRLREQIDLDALCHELVDVVAGTVKPAHASIWLRSVTIPERLSGTP